MCSPEDHLIAHGLLWPTLAHLRQLCSAPSFSYFLFQHRARSHCKCRQKKKKKNSNIKLFVLISHIYFPPGWARRRHKGSCPTLNPAGWVDLPSCFEPHLTSSMPPQQLGFPPLHHHPSLWYFSSHLRSVSLLFLYPISHTITVLQQTRCHTPATVQEVASSESAIAADPFWISFPPYLPWPSKALQALHVIRPPIIKDSTTRAGKAFCQRELRFKMLPPPLSQENYLPLENTMKKKK